MKITKTDWRSRLKNTVLNDLMMIQFNTPEIEHFNPISSIQLWNTSSERNRRPCFMEVDVTEVDEQVMTEEEIQALKKIY